MGLISIIALGGSIGLTVLVWKLGVIRFMVNIQNQRQARLENAFDDVDKQPERYSDSQKKLVKLVGRKSYFTYEFGTGRSATISFLGMFWLISFCLIMFGLIIYT